MKYLAIRLITIEGNVHWFNLIKSAFTPDLSGTNKKDYEANSEDYNKVLNQTDGQGYREGSISLIYTVNKSNNMKTEPIKTQKEADEVFKFLVDTTVKTLDVSREQAEKRINALYDSKILDGLNPNSQKYRETIDKFMITPI